MQRGTTFEKELRKIFDDMDCFEEGGMKYVGRAFYGKLDDELILKAQYVTQQVMDHYSALKLEIIKRNDGVVDTNTIRFSEFWGNKPTDNPNFRNGVHPYIWKDGDNIDWYVYHPTPQDMKELRDTVEDFVSVYHEFDIDMNYGMGGMQGM